MTDSDFISKAVAKSETKVEFDRRCTRLDGDTCMEMWLGDACLNCPLNAAHVGPDDPAAWPKLFDWIEEQGLEGVFMKNLDQAIVDDLGERIRADVGWGWYRIKATEAQKSSALVRAIKERDNGK